MHMPLPKEWIDRLKPGSRVGKELIIESAQTEGHPYGEAIRRTLDTGVSGVLCLNNSPCAAVVLPPHDCNSVWLQELYTNLWNQGELDFLLLLFPDRVDIHTLDADPRSLEASSTPLAPVLLDILSQAGEIEEIITGLESGRFLEKKAGGFNAEARVDASLIRDLERARERILSAEGFGKSSKAPKELIEQVHDVLLQSMFLLYLEDRGIIEAGYIHLHGDSHVGKLHDLLCSHPSKFLHLLARLDRDLNGGLFKPNPLWEKHSQTLAEFLQGMWNFENGQGRFLRLYRFEHIPVELLSEVYDRFLGSEGEKKKQGAYYTPRRLAALVVEQAWESLKSCLDAGRLPRILDPSCGSGIFSALLFQRIAGYFPTPSWDDLKRITEHLHGIDINPTAVRISAFSLYLALLHRAMPKELRALMDKGKALPELLGSTLIQGDFFEHSTEVRYDCIIGNPPWGNEKQATAGTGELWAWKNKYPKAANRERSWPFIWKSLAHLHAEGNLVLLLPATGFFLNDVKESLIRLLNVARLDRLIDLSDLRHVLFGGAIFPACVLSAKKTEKRESYDFSYVCPKADLNAIRGDRILLAEGDQHIIDAHSFAAESVSATQRLMWFGPHERRLLSYLDTLPTLRGLPLLETDAARKKYPGAMRPDWGMGLGFQKDTGKEEGNKKKPSLPELLYLPHADVKKDLTPWVQVVSPAWKPYGKTTVRRPHFQEGYLAPHIVIPYSLRSDYRLRASFSEQNFSFNNSAAAITVPDSDTGRTTGKFLTAFLNSAFSAWYMAARGLAVNRPRFTPSIILSLPFPQSSDLPDHEHAKIIRAEVVAVMDELMQQAEALQKTDLRSPDAFPSERDIRKLDDLIFTYLGIKPNEIGSIRENLELVRKAAQPARKGKRPKLWECSEQKHWDTYCDFLGSALSAHMDGGDQAHAEAIGYSKDVVVVQITYQQGQEGNMDMSAQRQHAILLHDLPQELLQSLERPLGGNVYLQRCATVFAEDYILLVKPRQRRFWLSSTAHMDADHILSNLLQAAEVGGDHV